MKKKNWIIATIAILISIIYLSYNITLGYDSSHYIWLSTMFTEQTSFQNWDVVRSFVFPLGIYLINILLGKSRWSLLIGTFVFYMAMIIACIKIYEDVIEKNENSKIVKFLIIAIFFICIALNPIIFGFYHVILTEFVAMTLIVWMCYLAWKWIECNFFENKKRYIIYSIVFAILVPFSWHLKQPYLLATLIPLFTATIISIVKKHDKKNVLQRIIVLAICIVTWFISIMGWNMVLKIGNVKQVQDRTTSGLVDNIIINGISMYQRDNNPEMRTVEGIKNNDNILEKDKEKIIKILEGKDEGYKNYIIFDYKPNNEIIENSMILYLKDENISTSESLQFFFTILKEHPSRIIESYIMNYLTINDIYKMRVDMTYGMKYYIERTFSWEQETEINFLGYSIYRESRNDLDLPEFYAQYAQEYCDINSFIPVVNNIMTKRMGPAVRAFKIIMIFLPIYWIISLIMLIRKNKKYTEQYKRIQQLITIIYTYAVAQMALYVVAGSIVDRYVVPLYLATLIALMLQIFLVVRRKNFIKVDESNGTKLIESKKQKNK